MQRYSRYIISRITLSVIVISMMLTGIAWLSQSLRFIELVVNHGLEIGNFLYLTLLIIPSLLWIILPIALMISIIYVYNRLYSDSELVILSSSGFSKWQIMRPAIIVGIAITSLLYLIAIYIFPASQREYRDLQHEVKARNAAVFISAGNFITPNDDLAFYISKKDSDGNLQGIFYADKSNKDKDVVMMAKTGRLLAGDIPRIILNNGTRQERDTTNNNITMLHFEQYTLDVDIDKNKPLIRKTRKTKELYIDELLSLNSDNPRYLEYMSELHHRLSWPLFGILISMIVLVPFVTGSFSRHGKTRSIITSSTITVICLIAGFILRNYIKKSHIGIYGIYGLSALILTICLVVLKRR